MSLEELRNAIGTTDAGVTNVIPEDLEPVLIEYLYKTSPLIQLTPRKQANAKVHEVALRSDVPEAWVEGELTSPTARSSTYARKTVQLKIFRTAGGVSNFAQAASRDFIDLLASEQEAAVESIATLIEYALMWGHTEDQYQIDGLDANVASSGDGHVFDVDGTVSLGTLDNMIDTVEQYRGVPRDPKAFIMSRGMISKISGLESRVGIDLTELEFDGGLRMMSYRGYPMIPAHYVKTGSTTTSPTVTATAVAGGSLAVGTYRYKVASVTMDGEQPAGVADSAASAASNNTIDLSWSADSNAKLYKIYRTATDDADNDDNYDLLAVIPAKTYDGTGAVSGNTTSYSDDGTVSVNADVHPLAANDETIWLADFNPRRGYSMVWLPNDEGRAQDGRFLRYLPLGRTKSAVDFMLEAFLAAQLPQPETCAVARRVTTS